jgi:drug/metabolite transporter (DMT)-like permease
VAVAAVIAVTIIWGVTPIITKYALLDAGFLFVSVGRQAISAAAILPVAAYRWRRRRDRLALPWAWLTGMAVLGVPVFTLCHVAGIERTSAASVGLILGSSPAVTAALGYLLFREVLGVRRALALLCSMGGVAAVLLHGDAPGGRAPTLVGNLLILGAITDFAVYSLLARRARGRVSDFELTASSLIIGAVTLLPLGLYAVAAQGWPRLTRRSVLSLLFLGLGSGVTCYRLWNLSLQGIDATEASTYLNLMPLVSIVAAAAMLGERISVFQITGGLLVIGGVYGMGRASRRAG